MHTMHVNIGCPSGPTGHHRSTHQPLQVQQLCSLPGLVGEYLGLVGEYAGLVGEYAVQHNPA